jgi:hypothetical protein
MDKTRLESRLAELPVTSLFGSSASERWSVGEHGIRPSPEFSNIVGMDVRVSSQLAKKDGNHAQITPSPSPS